MDGFYEQATPEIARPQEGTEVVSAASVEYL